MESESDATSLLYLTLGGNRAHVAWVYVLLHLRGSAAPFSQHAKFILDVSRYLNTLSVR